MQRIRNFNFFFLIIQAATVYYNTADAKNCYNVANKNMNEMYNAAQQQLENNDNVST